MKRLIFMAQRDIIIVLSRICAERTDEYEFLDEPVRWDYLRIAVSRQYDDGFMDVYTFLFTKTSDDNEVIMWQQGYALFYVTE